MNRYAWIAGAVLLVGCAARPVRGPIGASVSHLSPDNPPPNSIIVTMTGLRNDHGMVRMGLYDTRANWPRPNGAVLNCAVPIHGTEATCVFGPLRPGGDYAIAGSHDENNDGRFNQNVLGAPLEGFAFSNDARPMLEAPSWDECKVRFAGGIVRMRISTQY